MTKLRVAVFCLLDTQLEKFEYKLNNEHNKCNTKYNKFTQIKLYNLCYYYNFVIVFFVQVTVNMYCEDMPYIIQ